MHFDLSGLISIAAGIYALLVAFGVVQASKNPDANLVWRRKYGPMMKILGPILILSGLAELLGLLNRR
jgi:hypothetical protein